MGSQVKKTNSSGVAVFKSLGGETYAYAVTKGDVTKGGVVTVESSAVSVTVADFQ